MGTMGTLETAEAAKAAKAGRAARTENVHAEASFDTLRVPWTSAGQVAERAASFGGAPAAASASAPEPAAMPEPASSTSERIREIGSAIEPDVIAWRRDFHRHPELAWQEHWTQGRLQEALDALGIPSRPIAGTGLLATIRGEAPGAYDLEGSPARRIALRSDIDALPVLEQTGLDFASENEGVMHACGHDCHMAMMLGAARILRDLRTSLRGEVRILFQPAEEVAGGAARMIREGALDGVDAIYGAHIWSDVDAGTVSCEPGKRMANTDWFRVDIEGVGAHGSMPEKGVDAVVVGAEMVCALQAVVSRGVSAFEPVVVTVGEFHAGTARNVIAGSAWLSGTIRTWDAEMREEVPKRLERIVDDVALAFGATARFSFEPGNCALENDSSCAESARRAAVEVLGEQAVGSYQGTLSGEDFSEYLNLVPGVFVFVGTRNPDLGAVYPQHSCFYTVDESVLSKGSMLAAQWACDMLS